MTEMKTVKVLIVDDDPDQCEYLESILLECELPQHELEIESVTDPFLGHDRICTEEFDLLCLDVVMPDLNGIQLLSSIRSDRTNPNFQTLVFVLSGHLEVQGPNLRMDILDRVFIFEKPPDTPKITGILEREFLRRAMQLEKKKQAELKKKQSAG